MEHAIDVVEQEGALFIDTVRDTDPTLAVPDCPGWTMLDLVRHVARVHRWAGAAARLRHAPEALDPIPESWQDAVPYAAEGVGLLVQALSTLGADEPCWNFAPVAQLGGFWHRRQAHETTVHRWDAQRTVGVAGAISPEVAADGIDEIVSSLIPRWLSRDQVPADRVDVGGAIVLECTDVPGAWTLVTDGGEYRGVVGRTDAAAVVAGPAEAVLLALWNRVALDDPRLAVTGDAALVSRWLDIARG